MRSTAMLFALAMPSSGLGLAFLTGCGDGVGSTPPAEVCVSRVVSPFAATMTLGPATLSVPAESFATPTEVRLCREDVPSSGAVGPTFAIECTSDFASPPSITIGADLPGFAMAGQTLALAYWKSAAPNASAWTKFNDNDTSYAGGVVSGKIVVIPNHNLVVGPVLTCHSDDECASRTCFSGACQ